jgi:hypothetical protein
MGQKIRQRQPSGRSERIPDPNARS